MGFASKMSGCCSLGNKSSLFSVLGFVFVLLNLAALWALHFADRPVTKGSLRSATRFTSQLSTTAANVGDAVSFNSDNVLRTGAGITAYLNKLNLGSDLTGVKYINFAPMGTSDATYTTNVMSYQRTTTDGTDAVLTTVSYDFNTKTLTAAVIDSGNVVENPIRGIATLSDTQMAVLTVATDANYNTKVYVTPAALDSGKVTLNKAKTTQVATNSATNFIKAFTSTSFVMAYYTDYTSPPYYQKAVVGTIASNGGITLSTAAQFGIANDNDFNVQFGAPLVLKDIGVAIPYYSTLNSYADPPTSKTDADLSGLCVTYAKYENGAFKTFNDECDESYRPKHYPESVALSDNVMAVVFYDTANSNALTLVTLKVVGSDLKFQTSYVFTEVFGNFDYGKGYEFYTTPRLHLMSGNRLAVSFLNPALNGKPSVRILSYSTLSLAFKEVTPVLPVAQPNFTLAVSESGAVTHDLLPVGSDGLLAAYVGSLDSSVQQHFSVVETFTKPVGIIQSYSGNEVSIATQGRVDVDGLTSGEFHYATTSGALVAKGTSTDSNSAEYIYAAGDTVVVTADSRVGVATDYDTLFVSTSF
ncbi:unnamed protein product [Phytophthora lilii]|uniref:Unnamed protein product n=1 Tax=Phytophthora lilii TaxID=2077276 RepID=A0A9W6TPR5_9STRA|nr:unnamed protein product [Phytophthora lilii]